jgi:TctA family transporter
MGDGLFAMLAWPAVGFMLIGVAVGFVVGILPGLGGFVTLALMLPFTYTMTPIEALAFLLGMHAVTATTGDITSVLFGIPGEGTSAATIVDGHPMAKRGEAGRALGAVLMSSLVGAWIGAAALALSIPIAQPLVRTFGSPQLFMLTVLGVTFMSSLSSNSVMKGVLMGGAGWALALIGTDSQVGLQRYTFDQLYLWDGLSIIPIAIGMFAIPEMIDLSVRGTSIAGDAAETKIGGVMQGFADTFRHWGLVVRASLIGTFIGIIPGLGAAVGQWVAYGHAVQTSPNKERFGHGAIEGVLAPGAANNSKEGGALIPTIAFGVPGSIAMALILGAFIITGLVPGPSMLTEHLDVTFSMVWVVVISNLLAVILSVIFLKQLVKLTKIRGQLLIPFILLLVWIGAFTAGNDIVDLYVALLFGLIGYVMVKLDWPRPPVILGFLLGGLTERYLFISVTASDRGYEWLFNPVVMILIVISFASLFYPIWSARRERKRKGTPPSRLIVRPSAPEMAASLLIVALFAYVLLAAVGWPFAVKLFPLVISIPMLTLALIKAGMYVAAYVVKAPVAAAAGVGGFAAAVEVPAPSETALPSEVIRQRTIRIIAWMLGFILMIWFLGFLLGMPLFVFLYLKLQARESWAVTVVGTGVAALFIVGLFDQFMHLPWPLTPLSGLGIPGLPAA